MCHSYGLSDFYCTLFLKVETMSPHLFTCENTVRHGFPYKPTALAFEPVQHLLAIGNRVGQVRIPVTLIPALSDTT